MKRVFLGSARVILMEELILNYIFIINLLLLQNILLLYIIFRLVVSANRHRSRDSDPNTTVFRRLDLSDSGGFFTFLK